MINGTAGAGLVAKGEMYKAGQATGAPGFNLISFIILSVIFLLY